MIFLTGANGFVGRCILDQLLMRKQKIKALILPGTPIPFENSLIEWVEGDIRDKNSLSHHFSDLDLVVHLAGIVANSDEKLNFETNFLGTKHLVDLSKENCVRRFIFMSAAAAKFKTLNSYGKSKKMSEDYIIDSSISYTILRTPLIIGKGGEEFDRFVDYVRKFPKIVLVFGDGKPIKRPIYIGDVTSAIIKIINDDQTQDKVYEIACQEKLTLDEFIDVTCATLGKRKIKIHIPLKFSLILAGVLESLLGDKSPITKDILLGLNEDIIFDTKQSFEELNLLPSRISDVFEKCI